MLDGLEGPDEFAELHALGGVAAGELEHALQGAGDLGAAQHGAAELQHLHQRHGVEEVAFQDETFFTSSARVATLSRELLALVARTRGEPLGLEVGGAEISEDTGWKLNRTLSS